MEHFSLIGNSPIFRQLLNTAQLVAATRATVLISGESGCGKENLARFLHTHSPLASRPFIAVNCANLPENLVESELFGHRRGAFSNAVVDRDGLVRAAHNGTLFLDEIGELPMTAQAKLLRFLENGEILPLGYDQPIKANVRVIAATNCDLEKMVKIGRFRADLFYRLQVVPMEVPPLRERAGDIALLITHFIELAAQQHGLPTISFDMAALGVLRTYSWPGNVRELKNLCERLTILCGHQHGPLGVGNLPLNMHGEQRTAAIASPATAPLNLEQTERDMILQALEQTRGNRSRAAKLLGISRYTLLYRMKKYFAEEKSLTLGIE
ncbi:MAG: sigma-54 dependent transcriptional regulator [Betaproteobacteria bacterium]|nr:sigma-54 dependent transcriptional regulator [Betaproteobacteria bacterium]